MSKVSGRTEQQGIRVGWASRDITPNEAVNLIGQGHVRISQYVNDPLTVTALAIESEDDNEQVVMVSVDAVVIKNCIRDRCREMLNDGLAGFDSSMLVINATHTHTAPAPSSSPLPLHIPNTMSVEVYSEILIKRIVEAATEAWEKRKPGAVSWGLGQAVVGHNRRTTYRDGVSRMYGNTDDDKFSHIEGYEDHGVDMLFTYDADSHLTGMIVNLACPSQVTECSNFVSADFWHETRTEIRKRHGDKLFILPQCSAAGDQSPHLLLHKKAEARMLELKGLMTDEDREKSWQFMGERAEIANRIANAVDEVMPLAAKDIHNKLVFEHKAAELDLPRRQVTEEELVFAKEQLSFNKENLAKCDPDPAGREYSLSYRRMQTFQRVIDRYDEQNTLKTLPISIHIIRLGDIAFATNRFEYFLDYGERIKARSKAIQTFVVQLVGEGTYLPTKRAIESKCYGTEVKSCPISPDGGQIIVDESVRMINEMFG